MAADGLARFYLKARLYVRMPFPLAPKGLGLGRFLVKLSIFPRIPGPPFFEYFNRLNVGSKGVALESRKPGGSFSQWFWTCCFLQGGWVLRFSKRV